MKTMKILLALAAATVTALGAAAPAQATDRYPCGPATTSPGGVRNVHYCRLWTGNVPVYNEIPSSTSLGPRRVIGRLYRGGSANWFLYQSCLRNHGGEFHLGSYYNIWWAFTEADNGRFGWVPEVYFKGGSNNEMDAGLPVPVIGWC